ncbi:MarR family winged helix-turn-helix transcriptional regulator [Tepidimicrobium xylanilyticum]|uniref:DNA-binding transcriptional regulator, MarR family n=1 Tax=Tepidimicrobium xylanilyticum TaxID=1123352 RepID=A0A1H3A9Q5_9FIRM|nr:MarR family transcriptional regulator [Tepidimicrobium xylanilyticum]GMG96283.1 putative HTH-type transcriptional regulator YsmB [Tepidimicrobium xylanilyticum]SDX26028.1 DNA-binding transcriptional regulator, MarR family [Tepidimicrobium xylanilyticum]
MKENNGYDSVVNIERYLRRIDRIIRLKGREILKDYNTTIPQFTALQILINNEEMTIGELSEKMALACSTITDLVDRMEKNELVIRKKDEKDRRVVRIEVLPKGHDIVKQVLEKRIDFLNAKMASFTEEEKKSLSKLLESLYDAIKDDDACIKGK